VLSTPFSGIRRLIKFVEERAPAIAVLAVINVKSRTRHLADYTHHSMRSSFLNDLEIDAIIEALRECGFFTQHFADEQDFFSWVLAGSGNSLSRPCQLVYTSALNGSGPGRRALVPAFCSHLSIPTLNSDAYSCAINRQKFHVSRLLQSFSISVPRSWYFIPGRGWWDGDKPTIGELVVAKATYEGSSVGVDPDAVGPFSPHVEERIAFLSDALRQPITVQELIAGFELEVPIARLGSQQALGVAALTIRGESRLDQSVLLYNDAWEDDYGFSETSEFPPQWISKVERMAERAADVLNFQGLSRIDFRMNDEGEPFVIDVSSTPHLTPNNSIAFLYSHAGLKYRDIFNTLVGLAIKRHGLFHSSDQNSSSAARKPLP
jgi:D-alanine-D-alanine ligase